MRTKFKIGRTRRSDIARTKGNVVERRKRKTTPMSRRLVTRTTTEGVPESWALMGMRSLEKVTMEEEEKSSQVTPKSISQVAKSWRAEFYMGMMGFCLLLLIAFAVVEVPILIWKGCCKFPQVGNYDLLPRFSWVTETGYSPPDQHQSDEQPSFPFQPSQHQPNPRMKRKSSG